VTRLFASVACAAKRQPYFGVEVTSVCGELLCPAILEPFERPVRYGSEPMLFTVTAPRTRVPICRDMKGAMATTGHSSCALLLDGVNRAEWNASSIDHVNRVSGYSTWGPHGVRRQLQPLCASSSCAAAWP